MLRELRKVTTGLVGRRVGTVLENNGDGTYDISVDGARYNNVPSVSFHHYQVGESVSVNFAAGRPSVEP